MQRRDHQDGQTGNAEIPLDSLDTDKCFWNTMVDNALLYELYMIEYSDIKLFMVIDCCII